MKRKYTDPRVGDIVRIKGFNRKVVEVYDDIKGGVRLNEKVHDFYSWNVEDLELLSRIRQPKNRGKHVSE